MHYEIRPQINSHIKYAPSKILSKSNGLPCTTECNFPHLRIAVVWKTCLVFCRKLKQNQNDNFQMVKYNFLKICITTFDKWVCAEILLLKISAHYSVLLQQILQMIHENILQ